MSRLGLEVGRDGGSVTVPGRLVPLGTPTVIPAGSASRAEQIQVPHPPPDPPGRGELVPRSYSSMPQFLFAHKGVTAQWGLQPRNPSLHTSATVPAPASTQSSACGGDREEGKAFGSGRDVSHPRRLWKARPCCIWDLFICRGAFLWRDNAERLSVNCRAEQECPGLHHPCKGSLPAGSSPTSHHCRSLSLYPMVGWSWGGC